ncbi:MAG: NAD-dependent epimerase/dehydratase family protein [Bacteroidetes bacterium]|nr:NAD-dependent epimerase/dehydratase family protein [Bacteroidota bacterium]HET6245733.1 NAD-dependent epimerase/dehydratase family protein [Bacteroidia bacterium]
MILITGGTGLLGAHLLVDLVKAGHKVRALKRESSNLDVVEKTFKLYAPDYSFRDSVEWIIGDIRDIFSLYEALEGVEYIYHCAALVSFNPKYRDLMMEVNGTGTANLMNAALEKKVKKVCHVSSVAALGKTVQDDPISEENWWKNAPENTGYAISKYSAEREAWRAAEEGLDLVIVNPSVILGSGDWSKGSAGIISTAYKGMKFFATGITGFVDVRDVSKCMIKLMEGSFNHQRYIISSENVNFKDLFNLLHDNFGKKRPTIKAGKFLRALTWRTEFVRSLFTGSVPLITRETANASASTVLYSNEKIRKHLNFEFIPVAQTIKEICQEFIKEK